MIWRSLTECVTATEKAVADAPLERIQSAARNWAVSPVGSTQALNQIREANRPLFVLAALRTLAEDPENRANPFLLRMILDNDLVLELVLDPWVLSLSTAIAITRRIAREDPQIDARLVRRLQADGDGTLACLPAAKTLQLLHLIDAVSGSARAGHLFTQLLRHPDPHVRSKAVLILGRTFGADDRLERALHDDDARLRANAVEALWGFDCQAVRRLLKSAAQDTHARTRINALVGLCRIGEKEAFDQLVELACSGPGGLRHSAVWGLGASGHPAAEETLRGLLKDRDAKVRWLAVTGLARLRRNRSPEAA